MEFVLLNSFNLTNRLIVLHKYKITKDLDENTTK